MNWPLLLYWFMGGLTAIMLFVSVLLHELGHSVVVLRYKIPVRSITFFLFEGVAQMGTDGAIPGNRLETSINWPGGGQRRPLRLSETVGRVNPGASDECELKPLSDNDRLRKGDLVRILTPGIFILG